MQHHKHGALIVYIPIAIICSVAVFVVSFKNAKSVHNPMDSKAFQDYKNQQKFKTYRDKPIGSKNVRFKFHKFLHFKKKSLLASLK